MVKISKRVTTVFTVEGTEYLDRDAAIAAYQRARMYEFWEGNGFNGMDKTHAANVCLERADALRAILHELSPFEQE